MRASEANHNRAALSGCLPITAQAPIPPGGAAFFIRRPTPCTSTAKQSRQPQRF